jgi:serralysin
MPERAGTTGDDTLDAFAFGDENRSNQYRGDWGDDLVIGGHKEDELYGHGDGEPQGSDDDTLIGGGRADNLLDDYGENSLVGGAGDDTIMCRSDELSTLLGGSGSDFFWTAGDHLVRGEQDNDIFSIGSGSPTMYGGAGRDYVFSQDEGALVAPVFFGGEGNDVYLTTEGADAFFGGLGRDTVSYEDVDWSDSGVVIDLRRADQAGAAAGDQLRNVEHVTGSSFADQIVGSSFNNKLWGELGDDTLVGGGGDDTLSGGPGVDVLAGGAGADKFGFQEEELGPEIDVIRDFSREERDRIGVMKIDADQTRRGNQDFDFIGMQAFSGEAGELRIESVKGGFLVQGDVDGDGDADLFIEVRGASTLVEDDFAL